MAKTFDQYLAESGRQSELDNLRATGGYDAAKSSYESSGSYGSSGGSSSATFSGGSFQLPNFQDTVKQALELSKQANAPAIASLTASLPEISTRFSNEKERVLAEKAPLQERYQNLLDEVTGKAEASVNRQTRVTSNELGKRGIVGSSTLAQQEILDATEPIRAGERTAVKDIGLAQEAGIRDIENTATRLVDEETTQRRAIQNAIAQLEAGGGQAAITNALNLLQVSANTAASQVSLQLQKEQQQLANKIFEQITVPESKANIANVNSTIANRGSDGGALTASDFLSLFGFGSGFGSGFGGGGNLSIGSNVIKLLQQGDVQGALNLAYNP